MKKNKFLDRSKLKKFKQKLIEARVSILHGLELERECFIYSDQGDIVDIADNQVLNSVLSTLSGLDEEKLRDISLALEKIKDGSYGICEGSGKKIPEARLNQIPWARHSIEYAEREERERKMSNLR